MYKSFLTKITKRPLIVFGLLLSATPITNSEILFEEVTEAAGIDHTTRSFGASWGDFDGDGWPDIWLGNHFHNPPSLFLNQRNGGFSDIASEVWSANPVSDAHGAAWADFDNDGDQDLIELVGASYGEGQGANHLFLNNNGLLNNRAVELGVAYPLGRGRTPLWLDADNDGLLDLLLINMPRRDRAAPSALFIQHTGGFRVTSPESGLPDQQPSKLEQFFLRAQRYIADSFGMKESVRDLSERLRGSSGSLSKCINNSAFATLADLGKENTPQLVICADPLRFFSFGSEPFRDFSEEIGLPRSTAIQDAVFGDFNGDGNTDIYLVRSKHWTSQSVLVSPSEIHAYLVAGDTQAKEIRFKTDGALQVQVYGDFSPDQILLGTTESSPMLSEQQPFAGMEFDLSPSDPSIAGLPESDTAEKNIIRIGYDASQRIWIVRSTVKSVRLEIASTSKITGLRAEGFESSTGARSDRLLIQTRSGFEEKQLPDQKDSGACHSVAAGDFDNDMDLDIYLVCSAPAINTPNQLYENIGDGQFIAAPRAGGAEGPVQGRGDSVAVADYDQDGFLDLFVTNGRGEYEGPVQLFRNKGNRNHWIEVDLEGSKSNRDGIGATLELKVAGSVQKRIQSGGMHRYSQNHHRIHFGLGENNIADYIKIKWPSGIIQIIHNVKADQLLRIKEPLDQQAKNQRIPAH